MSTHRRARSKAYLRSPASFDVKAPSTVRGSSQSRGAMISTNSPSPFKIRLTSATLFLVLAQSRSAGQISSSWNWTASKPELLVGFELLGVFHLFADRGPERVSAGADVPGTKRELVLGGCLWGRVGRRLFCGQAWGVSFPLGRHEAFLSAGRTANTWSGRPSNHIGNGSR